MRIKKAIRTTVFGVTALAAIGMYAVDDMKNNNDNSDEKIVFAAESDMEEISVNGDDTKENETSTNHGTADQIYGVGSVSKVYVTTAVMQLVEQGKVDLDAPVTDYIDDFRMADERYKDITVRMLMNHTSGIAGTSAKNMFLYGDNDFVMTDNVLKNLQDQRLKADPGEYASYCNDGFELLEIIVERVSGLSYTEYVEMNIADKIGAANIYTAKSVFGNANLADIYPDGHNRYETEYCMDFGSGGIYSTALDTCEFGSTFFKGDNRLLSEESKNEMATLWSSSKDVSGKLKYDPAYMDQNGLGWDLVDIPMYEDAGVKALYKGGDTRDYHAALLVMPEEEISICVTTAEGSSGCNLAMAESLANIILEEDGTDVEETAAPEVELQEKVPDSYKQYEGLYTVNGAPAEITFPDMKYALIKMIGSGTSDSYYMFTKNGFVKVTGDIEEGNARVDVNYNCVDFEDVCGHIYITQEMISKPSGLISTYQKTYIGEKMEMNPVSEDVLNAWQEREEMIFELISDKYSSAGYNAPFVSIKCLDDSGYVVSTGLGKDSIFKVVDADHLETFNTIPSSSNRDACDIYIDESGKLCSTYGIYAIPESENKSFTADVKEVELTTDEAVWYNIDDSMANKTISLDRPENSAVYVYDKFGQVKYSSHMTEYGNIIHLPKNGYIVFVGEDGGTVSI
ncbi:MAG: beta-lactamase family protein, partial [Eubacterium sp.]|nr:beta-lactamase family protein [Eubacterium sp.]